MSRVFVALETALNRHVAIKVLPEAMAGQLSVDRFRREIALAAQLQHPHIVPLLSAGEVGGLPYFTMPFVRGESLRARLSAHGELPVNEAVRVLREVASALASAHHQGVVHRDIKPDNVLLSGDAAMVTDFGVAKAVSASTLSSDSGLTSIGVALGTPAYMSPEQASADPLVDARSDIYAWGILAYEMLTGATPFTGRPTSAMLAAHVTELPEDVARRRPNIPTPLATLIMRCLEKRASDRPQRAQELVQALDAMVTPTGGSHPTTARHASLPASDLPGTMRRRAWTRVAIPIVAIGVLVVAMGPRVWSRGSSQTRVDSATTPSVAVLPFVNVGGDTANAYFADGLTDDLASALARTGKLRVAARSSAYSFKGRNVPPADVGHQLHVGVIVEGSVQRVNGHVKVIASLVSVTDGLTLWTNVYERDTRDVFAVQAELSHAIAGAMRVSLAGTSASLQAGTASVEAHDLVLRGRYLNDRFDEPSVRHAIDRFRQALALDPRYADAWTGIADSWGRLSDDHVAPNEAAPHLRDALDHALALDPASAKALALRGLSAAFYERKFDAALTSLEQSLLRDSTDGFVGVYFGEILLATAHRDSAVAAMQRALRLDPLATEPLRYAIDLFRRAHADREADAACERLIELSPASVRCRPAFKLDAARATHLLDSGSVASRAGRGLVARARLEAVAGRKADARRDIARAIAEAEASHRYFRAELYAKVYALLRDKDETMRWLEKAYEANSAGVPAIPSDPDFAFLDGDPRFMGLVKRIGLPVQR